MTFPKKGTRCITYRSEKFNWRYGRSRHRGRGIILIEKAGTHGQVLSVRFPTDINELWLDFSEPLGVIQVKNYKSATPAMISKFIEQALKLGWENEVSKGPLKLVAYENDKLQLDVE